MNSSKRGSLFLRKSQKSRWYTTDQLTEDEMAEEHSLNIIAHQYPQTVEEEISMVFNTYNMPPHFGSSSRRKREKGINLDGTTTPLAVDRRKSKVWNYYTKLGDAFVECNVCKKHLSFHNSTTTMREHLVRKHSIRETLLSQLKEEQASEPEEILTKRPRQVTPDHHHLYHISSCPMPRTDMITDLVLEMIFRDLHPLSVVEDKGFGLLIGYLEPNFSLPSPVQLSSMLWHKYNVVKQHLERYLHTAESIVLSLDFWDSLPDQSFLTVTANFIDFDWRFARCILETQQVHEAELKDNLPEKLYTVLVDFGLAAKSVFCVLHDRQPDMLAKAEQLQKLHGWTSVCCAASMLHQCVETGLQVEQVQEALRTARQIIGFFQQDGKASSSLNSKLEAMNKIKMKLVMDVPSRWLTTIEMCESLLDLKWAIMSVLEEQSKNTSAVQNLADHQWKLLQDLVPIMRTVKIATSFLREEQNMSTSSLMPCVHGIVTAIGQQSEECPGAIKTVVNHIKSQIQQKWGMLDEQKLLESPAVLASFLDPRFKEVRFLNPSTRSELHTKVKQMLSEVCFPQDPPTPISWGPAECKVELGDSSSHFSWHKDRGSGSQSQSIYDILLGKDPTESMPEIHQQLENYIVEPLCKRSASPLDWWRSNEHRFPMVAKLARQYLAIPATAVLPGRAFAPTESPLEHRRAVLSSEHLDQILFLHQNFDFLESMKNAMNT